MAALSHRGRSFGRHFIVNIETTEPTLQPGMAERAIDTATDVSRTITEVSEGLRAAVDRQQLPGAQPRGVHAPAAELSRVGQNPSRPSVTAGNRTRRAAGERTREDDLDRTCPAKEMAAIGSMDASGPGRLTLNTATALR